MRPKFFLIALGILILILAGIFLYRITVSSKKSPEEVQCLNRGGEWVKDKSACLYKNI
jgi:hypothetical protein